MKQPRKASSGSKPKAITYLGHVIRISPLDKKFIANVFDPDQTKPEPIYTTTEDSVHVAEDKARRFIERWIRWIETKKKAENWE
jgi:hypothetical protein